MMDDTKDFFQLDIFLLQPLANLITKFDKTNLQLYFRPTVRTCSKHTLN